ncbi:membrane-associated tyrosine-and threonine-specific cdc2-inhibitory kinase [Plakobranchus ocellatus]|uniref:non-specific serine/threonine protein kinase n=1 Tax=Plakobranchus ocellatus TaxID=259542 RepID=A0AAV4CDL7_9GAST|nr:membrane-associated tyrosine-and threonine-specific cdc2-inhibitory kinase [Plakobranchus ocellatus]
MNDTVIPSPRPTPRFYTETQLFSTKKLRTSSTPRDHIPPRPPVKSCPPLSRVFPHRTIISHHAQPVSFRHSESSLLSPKYNENSNDSYFEQMFDHAIPIGYGSFGEALKHLHDHNLVHMDIKPDNAFISFDGICKLGDFGLVIDLTKKRDVSDAIEGDPKYLAPELLEGQFGKHADIFSLGIFILELLTDLELPRGGEGWHMLRNGDLPDNFFKDLPTFRFRREKFR